MNLKYNSKIVKELIGYIEAGSNVATACKAVGLSRVTFYEWLKDETKTNISYTIIQKAESRAIARNVAVIQVAAKNNWTASAWFLERKKSEDWGRKDNVKLSGDSDKPVVVRFKNSDDK